MIPRISLLPVCLLLSTVHGLDQDADQISDVYAEHHGLASGSTDEDPDGDGQRNFEESAWGTDPFDSNSVFRPVSSQVADGLYDFAIPTIPGKRYQFQGRPDLVTGSWIDIDLPFTGTGTTEHLLTSLPISGTNKFFWRVRAVSPLDSDGDGLDAFEEILLGTSDTNTDSDSDKVGDLAEFLSGLDPATNLDLDSDGLPDDWEAFHGAYSANADNDSDGWTNLEEFTGGDNPNELNNTLAPPTLIVHGDYSQSGDSYTVLDGGELRLHLHSNAPQGTTHYLIEAPHLPPHIRFNGTSPAPISLTADADRHDPGAGTAAIIKVNNGQYTIRAKTYLSVGGEDYESAEVEFTVEVEPFPRVSLPDGMKYVSVAYYDPAEHKFFDFSFDVPEHLRRFTCSGWLTEAESTFSPDYWLDFVPDLTSTPVSVYAGYRSPGVFSENSLSTFWGTETVVDYGRGWAAGDELYCDFGSISSRRRYYGDSRNGWISDSAGDVNDLWEEDLWYGWMTTDGFVPDKSTTVYADNVYYDDERGRLTFSQPQGLDNDEDLGQGWIGGWMNRFISEKYGRDTDRDLVPDGLEEALGLNIGYATSPPEDSDGDGLLDAVEVQQGSNPSNPNDTWPSTGSFEAAEKEIVSVLITFGDPSGSHSEQWQLDIYELDASGSRTLERTIRADLGVLSSREIQYVSGKAYELELSHVRGSGDYDYLFDIKFPEGDLVAGSSLAELDDPDNILGQEDNISLELIEGSVKLNLVKRTLKSEQGEELSLNLNGTRSPVYFEATPAVGDGSFVLSQSNDKIRVWSAETGGVELTGPGSAATRMAEWDMGDAQLATLNTMNRVWVEGLETSEEIGDTALKLTYLDSQGNAIDQGVEIEVTVFDVELDFIEPQPLVSGGTVVYVGNNYNGFLPQAIDRENSVTLNVAMDTATRGLLVGEIDFQVICAEGFTPYSGQKGWVDTTDFDNSGGVNPIRYRTTNEYKKDKCSDLDVLEEFKYFEVVAIWNGLEVARSNRINVSSRFKYINKYSEPENQRYSRAIGFVGAKYNLPGDSPVYDSTLNDYGVVRTNAVLPLPPILFIQLGPPAFETENKLASTWIHETVHLKQGRSIIRKIAAGSALYEQYDTIGTDLSTISETEKDSIMDWINGETAAYEAELDSLLHTCLSSSEQLEINQQLTEFIRIKDEMY